MDNGLTPLMALKACDNPCVRCNLYKRLNKALDLVKDNNISRLLTERKLLKKTTDNIGVTRRKLFATPPSDTSTSNFFTPMSLDVPNTLNISCKKQNSWWGVRMQKNLQESLDVVNLIAMNEDKKELLRPNKKEFMTRRTPKQVNRNNKKEKKFKFCYDTKYKEVLKLATNCHKHNLEKKDNNNPKNSPTMSLRDIVKKHNLSLSPNAPKQLTRSTIHRYVSKGHAGLSPLKHGPASQIPLVFGKVMALHCRMIQNSLDVFIILYIYM